VPGPEEMAMLAQKPDSVRNRKPSKDSLASSAEDDEETETSDEDRL
jgi:hypothetical protein